MKVYRLVGGCYDGDMFFLPRNQAYDDEPEALRWGVVGVRMLMAAT